MGHDLGHTPFGHAGEKVLAHLMPDGFHHVKQSLRVVDQLERDGAGLNLTCEVRDGILKHSKGKGAIFSDNPNLTAMTLEGQIVRIADIAAYVNHDFDDAVRAGLVTEEELPEVVSARSAAHARRASRLAGTRDLVESSALRGEADDPHERSRGSRRSMPCAIFCTSGSTSRRTCAKSSTRRSASSRSCGATSTSTPTSSVRKHWPKGTRQEEGLDRAIGDFLCGMTDRYAMRLYQELRLPKPWTVY